MRYVARAMRRASLVLVLAGAGLVAVGPGDVRAQESRQVPDRLNVFFACEGDRCDPGPYRARIHWVNWMDGPDNADVRVSMTSESGSGGVISFVMDFAVADSAPGGPDRLFYRSAAADGEATVLDGIATTLAIGLARYAALAGYREFVVLRDARLPGIDPGERVVSAQKVADPWDFWVFTVGGNARAGGSDNRTTRHFAWNLSADRVTPTWKFSFNANGSITTQEIEFSSGTVFESDQRTVNINTTLTYALADHWSVNVSSLIGKFPTANQKLHLGFNPGVEYSLFPYEEATRRSLTVRYTIGLAHRNYEERTIYNETAQELWEQLVQARATMRQPWGDLFIVGTGSHFLEDIDRHALGLGGGFSVRLVRGLRFNVSGEISRVHDQVYLSASGITDEETLLKLRELQSFSNMRLNFGFSYQFGSIYNNTVNNRFADPGGDG